MSSRIYFEDCKVHDRVATSGRTLTATDMELFACLSPARSSEIPPLLALGAALGLLFRDNSLLPRAVLALTGLHAVQFAQPVFVGDTIRLVGTISALKRLAGQAQGMVDVEFEALNQRNDVVLSGSLGVLAASAEAP